MSSKLDQLKTMTDVVADTGDIEAIRRFQPQDATTNPSLLLKAAALPHYASLLDQAKTWAHEQGGDSAQQLANCCDRFAVDVGQGDPWDCSRSYLHRSGCPPVLRQQRHHGAGPQADRHV